MRILTRAYHLRKQTQLGYIMAKCAFVGEGQDPYLSCTYTEFEAIRGKAYNDVGGGALSTEFCAHQGMPELVPLVRWHLCSLERGPMHYVANAVYFAQAAAGVSQFERKSYDPDPTEAFKRVVVFGAVEGDILPPLNPFPCEDTGDLDAQSLKLATRAYIEGAVTSWCQMRLPALMSQFESDLRKFGMVE